MLFPWDFWNLLGHCSPQQPGIWTMSQDSTLGIETSVALVLLCTEAEVPRPARSGFSHLLLVSQSPSWEGGHLLTIRKTEALNCASHPQRMVGSEPWQHQVQSTVCFLSPALCGECGWPTAEKKETNTLGSFAARALHATQQTPWLSSQRWEEQAAGTHTRLYFLDLWCLVKAVGD